MSYKIKKIGNSHKIVKLNSSLGSFWGQMKRGRLKILKKNHASLPKLKAMISEVIIRLLINLETLKFKPSDLNI